MPAKITDERTWKLDRLRSMLSKSIKLPNGCLIWTGYTDKNGRYGQIKDCKDDILTSTHKFGYRLVVGEVSDEMELDHVICHNGLCWNPGHLEPVTKTENRRRQSEYHIPKLYCKYGHEYTSENTRIRPNRRICLICYRARLKFGHAKYSVIPFPEHKAIERFG